MSQEPGPIRVMDILCLSKIPCLVPKVSSCVVQREVKKWEALTGVLGRSGDILGVYHPA